jgi:hypothetical protein
MIAIPKKSAGFYYRDGAILLLKPKTIIANLLMTAPVPGQRRTFLSCIEKAKTKNSTG